MLVRTSLKIALLSVAGFVSLTPAPVSATETSIACGAGVLPASVGELLKIKFPLWRPREVSDLGSDDRKLWLKAHGGKCPGVAVGHFQSTDKLSYAVLLVRRSDPNDGYKIVIIAESPRINNYNSTILDHSDKETNSGMVLSTAPPGKYPSFDGLKSVTIKRDGLYAEVIEKGVELYFWSGSKYNSIELWR